MLPPPTTSLPPTLCAQTSEDKSRLLRSDANAELAAWPGLMRKARGHYELVIRCLNVGAAGVVVLLCRNWLPHEEALAKRVATACWEARRELMAARPDAGEAEQRAAVEDALLEASAPGALDAWRLLQRDGDEAPMDSADELSASQLRAACTLLAVGRDRWGSLPVFVRRRAEEGGLAVSKVALQTLAKQLRRAARPKGGRQRRRLQRVHVKPLR